MSPEGWILLGTSTLTAGLGVTLWWHGERALCWVCAGCAVLGVVAVAVLR